eukprot:5946905-Prorocentrum_lima.AAC.1
MTVAGAMTSSAWGTHTSDLFSNCAMLASFGARAPLGESVDPRQARARVAMRERGFWRAAP